MKGYSGGVMNQEHKAETETRFGEPLSMGAAQFFSLSITDVKAVPMGVTNGPQIEHWCTWASSGRKE